MDQQNVAKQGLVNTSDCVQQSYQVQQLHDALQWLNPPHHQLSQQLHINTRLGSLFQANTRGKAATFRFPACCVVTELLHTV